MRGVLKWPQLDDIWRNIDFQNRWYLYEIGRPVPLQAIDEKTLKKDISKIDKFLRQEHDADYCGVVYVDDLEKPNFVKIYHPKKMGSACGNNNSTVLPMWTLSIAPPIDLIEWALEKDRKPAWWKQILLKRI